MFQPLIQNSLSTNNLSEQIKLFTATGYFVFEEFLTESGVQSLTSEIDKLISRASPVSPHFVLRDQAGQVILMNGIDKESDYLYEFARSPTLKALASRFLQKQAMPLHVEYFAKPPGSSLLTPAHQDHIFYQEHFCDEIAISFWIALDNVTPESGALEYGSPMSSKLHPHKKSREIHFDMEISDIDLDEIRFTAATVSRGGCILHNSFVIHRAGPNLTPYSRRGVVFNYRGSDYLEWYQHKSN